MENTINTRIAELIKALGLNKNSFSKALGLENNASIGNIVGKRQSKPGYNLLYVILTTFEDINPDWLILGKGEMYRHSNQTESTNSTIIELLKNQLEQKDKEINSLLEILNKGNNGGTNSYSQSSSKAS